MRHHPRKSGGFTLLELIIVVAILAIIAGGLIAAYDGLDKQASKGVATFNIGALDQAIRTFAVVNNSHPDNYDSLLFSDDASGTDGTALNLLPAKLQGKLSPLALSAAGVDAFNAVGITQARYVTGASGNGWDNVAGTHSIPQRVFDNPTRGAGASIALAAGTVVAIVETDQSTDFLGAANTDSSRLRDIAGLDENLPHAVVAFGIGNNSTLVKQDGDTGTSKLTNTSLSEAPFYTDVPKEEYNRYIALYHIATDSNDDGTFDTGEHFSKARFLGVIDTKGDWYDEEYAEFTGQKQ